MSWSLPALKHNYFLVHIVDVPNAQRAKHLDVHLAHNASVIQDGAIKLAGGLLPQTSKTTDPDALQRLVGSWMIVRAESIEHAWEIVKEDPFYTSGEVWDREKVTVTPAYVATPDAKFD
ncbi:hypothetical protein BD414DRAFT_494876 [Trametes punicea]|nr:hypothetical protein BD414DRAFT_494876 [Trametes punicea]